jgi:hypothetical protein
MLCMVLYYNRADAQMVRAGEIDVALSAAKALGAHVEALFISQPPPVTR